MKKPIFLQFGNKALRANGLAGLSAVLSAGLLTASLALAPAALAQEAKEEKEKENQEEQPRYLSAVLDVDNLHQELASQPVYSRTAIELLEELEDKHYSRVVVDDHFSEELFERFLEILDGQKLYFLQEDVDYMEQYRHSLDDSLRRGDLQPAYDMYNLYTRRLLERIVYAVDRVENHLVNMDFSVDESFIIDREEEPYASTSEELDEIWRLRVKNSALSLKLTDMELEEIEERLSKRYRNQLNQLLKSNNRDVFQTYMATVANSVDPHTSYFSPRDSENFNMNLRLSLQGIGAQLTSEDEYTKVVELIKGGPAERESELKAGDRIVGIAQGVDGEMQDVVGFRLDDVVDQIRGEKGTVVRLNVIPAEAVGESQAHEVVITRDTVKLEDQSAKKEVLELSHNGEDYRIGVIKLPTFYFDFEAASAGKEDYKSSTRDVKVLLEELKQEGVDAVVMDLRDNGGGSLTEANQLVGLFIDSGATVQIRYSGLRNGFVRSYGDGEPGATYEGPLGVLVNRASASASEIFAGAIQDYQRGVVMGGQTFGKGTVQEIIPMDYGQVKLTRSKFYRVSGASTQNRGVLPDIQMPDYYSAFDGMGESELEGALPWDVVRPTEYDTYFPISEILPQLQTRHNNRVSSDPDFIYLEGQIERSRELRERKEVSLHEETVRAEREANRRAEFEADNMRRMMKGLPLKDWEEFNEDEDEDLDVASADDTPAENSGGTDAAGEPSGADETAPDDDAEHDDLELADTTGNDEAEEDEDPLLEESGHILIDMAMLLEQPLRLSGVEN